MRLIIAIIALLILSGCNHYAGYHRQPVYIPAPTYYNLPPPPQLQIAPLPTQFSSPPAVPMYQQHHIYLHTY